MATSGKKKISKLWWVLGIIVVISYVVLSSKRPAGNVGAESVSVDSRNLFRSQNFKQLGYFKDERRNRIFTYIFQEGTTFSEIQAHAKSLMHTSKQWMAAYYYPPGSIVPSDGVTQAGSVEQAKRVLYHMDGLSPWRYAFARLFSGTTAFVDCQHDPGNGLCRKD
jgi:hypothetical protein